MEHHHDVAELHALLALRQAAGSRGRGELAQRLCAGQRPWALLRAGRWRPDATAWGQAARWADAMQARALSVLFGPNLPPWARRLTCPPVLLCVRGPARLVWARGLAIVGARDAAPAVRADAEARARAAAAAGHLIISGGARGVDAAAHRGALAGGGRTVMVLGTPIDDAGNPAQRHLLQAVLMAGGTCYSEYLPGEPTFPGHFVERNRLIAGHCSALWVLAAGARSGSLSTARHARRLGRPIWVPHAAGAPAGAGLTWLVRSGWAKTLPWAGGPSGAKLAP